MVEFKSEIDAGHDLISKDRRFSSAVINKNGVEMWATLGLNHPEKKELTSGLSFVLIIMPTESRRHYRAY